MALPSRDDDEASEPKRVIVIAIDAKGNILIDGQAADKGPAARDIPLLRTELGKAAAAHPKGAAGLAVAMKVDAGVAQQRVIDVLNALAANEITRVIFQDE